MNAFSDGCALGVTSFPMLVQRRQFLLLAPLALVLFPFLVVPALFGLLSSFTDYAPLSPHIHFVGLRNYAAVLGDVQLRTAFRNIAIFALGAVPVELLIGFGIAYALREPFRGRGLVRVLLLVPWSVSPIAAGVMWHFLYSGSIGMSGYWLGMLGQAPQPSPLGLLGRALPAVIGVEIWRKAPLVSFLLLPGLLAIPGDLWEQARLDGASPLRRIRDLVVPSVYPLLLTVALLMVADTLATFESVLMMTGGGPGSATLTPALYSYQRAFQAFDWPAGVASAWLVVLAVVAVGIVYLLLARRMVENAEPVMTWEQAAQRRGGWARAIVVVGVVVAIALPMIWTVLASLGIVPDDAVRPPTWAPGPSTEHYAELVTADPLFLREFATSLAVSTTATLLTITIAFLASYGFARSRIRGTPVLVQGFLVLATLPVMAYVIPLSDLARHWHLSDTFAGVTLASVAVYAPLAVFVLYGYVAQTPPAQEESARLDGASLLQVLWKLVVPAAAPGLAAVAVLVFILDWNLFLVPLAIALPRIRTIPVVVSDFFLFERDLEWSTAAAALVVSLVPAVVLVAAAHRVLERFSLTPQRPRS